MARRKPKPEPEPEPVEDLQTDKPDILAKLEGATQSLESVAMMLRQMANRLIGNEIVTPRDPGRQDPEPAGSICDRLDIAIGSLCCAMDGVEIEAARIKIGLDRIEDPSYINTIEDPSLGE